MLIYQINVSAYFKWKITCRTIAKTFRALLYPLSLSGTGTQIAGLIDTGRNILLEI